jgi:hypothetical protein
MEGKITSRITKGLIIASLMLASNFIFQKIYSPVPEGTRYLTWMTITFTGVFAGCILYSKQSGGNLSFGDVFSHGLKTVSLVAFLMAIYTFIVYKFIQPMPNAAEMEAAVKAIEQQGNSIGETASQQAESAAKNRWIIYVSLSIFVSLIPGMLGSLAAAALIKKNR